MAKSPKSTAAPKATKKPEKAKTQAKVKTSAAIVVDDEKKSLAPVAGTKPSVHHPIEVIDPSQAKAPTDFPIESFSSDLFADIPDIHVEPDSDIDKELVELARKAKKRGAAAAANDADSKALTTTDPVATYLAEIRRYPLLTKEQERELAIRYRETGDPKAAEALVTSNLRFVVKVAAEYSRFGAKLIDLVQEGNVGLMHAVREFNPYKGVRLITYAVWWIRGYIQEYLMRQYSMVRIGTTQNQRKLFYRLQKEQRALEASGQKPTTALLAGRLGVSEEEVETMSQRLSGRDVSLNQPLSDDSPGTSLLDFEPSGDVRVDEAIGHEEEMSVLRENIEKIRPTLNEKEAYILEHRILAEEPLTLQEIGDHYHITREAVRQLEARLIGKLRSAVTDELGD